MGKLSEALEVVEDARGHLYGFHRLTGMADLALGEAVDQLRAAGHGELADRLETELVGRNVLEGRWTFQIVEEYDDDYYATFKRLESDARRDLVGGRRHLFEAEMKEDRRTRGPAPSRGGPGRSGGGRVSAEPPDLAHSQHSQAPDRFRCADTWVTSRCWTGTKEAETAFSTTQPP